MQELAFLVVTEGDFEAASQSNVMQRGPFLEACTKEYDVRETAQALFGGSFSVDPRVLWGPLPFPGHPRNIESREPKRTGQVC